MIIPDLKVTRVRVSDIAPYAKNAKTHPEYQVEQIANSIDQFGFNDPIAIDENNVIIEGHGRLLAAKRLGIQEVPVIRLEHLDDEAKRAYILAHNKLTMNTGFDFDALRFELESIDDFDMSEFGFDAIDGFDMVQDLMDEGLVGNGIRDHADFFNITFSFPVESRETVERYVKEFGKDKIVDRILEAAESWE